MTGDTPARPPADAPAALAEARRRVADGDTDGARLVLEEVLTGTATPAGVLVDAADLYAHLLVAAGQPSFACAWARYAGDLAAEDGGPADPRRLRAAETLAAALHADGRHAAAARQYRAVFAAHHAAEGPDAPRTRAAHARLAAVLAEAAPPPTPPPEPPIEYRRAGPRLGRRWRTGLAYAAVALAAAGAGGAAAWYLRRGPDPRTAGAAPPAAAGPRPADASPPPAEGTRPPGGATPPPPGVPATPAGATGGPTGALQPPPAGGAAVGGVPSPPGALRLVDRADSVLLTWAYPPGAHGPVLLTGGRRGHPAAALGVLAPGTDRYVVQGLRPAVAYCFTVAVVYSTDDVAAAPRACTTRPVR